MVAETPICPGRSREEVPLFSISIPKHNVRGQKVRMIKIRMDGPTGLRWINYARWWWLENRGPIPPGMRVAHADGDTLNDDPSNYKLCTGGEVAQICHRRDPDMSARNYAAAREGTARFNRESAMRRRMREWVPGRWYAVDLVARVAYCGAVARKRWQIERQFAAATPGRFAAVRGSAIATDPAYVGVERSPLTPGEAVAPDLDRLRWTNAVRRIVRRADESFPRRGNTLNHVADSTLCQCIACGAGGAYPMGAALVVGRGPEEAGRGSRRIQPCGTKGSRSAVGAASRARGARGPSSPFVVPAAAGGS